MNTAHLEEALQYHFHNPALLRLALTHPSCGAENNQRLEFLGDAVLQLAMSDIVFAAHPEQEEGGMTFLRARMVREGLAALPEDYRRVLVLRELHQLSYAEICEVTELELGTVKSRINRARLLLPSHATSQGAPGPSPPRTPSAAYASPQDDPEDTA